MNYTVIVAEYEELLLNNLVHKIEKADPDFQVIGTAQTGAQALSLVEQMSPDVVFTDIKMPVMDGIEALKEIRRHTAELPVIMQTAYAFDTDRRTAEEAGCNGFITKPVMPRELKMYLDKYLNK